MDFLKVSFGNVADEWQCPTNFREDSVGWLDLTFTVTNHGPGEEPTTGSVQLPAEAFIDYNAENRRCTLRILDSKMPEQDATWIVGVRFLRYFYTVYRPTALSVGMVSVSNMTATPTPLDQNFPSWVWILIGACVTLIVVMIAFLICFRGSSGAGPEFDQVDDTDVYNGRRISIHISDADSRHSSVVRDPSSRYKPGYSRTWLSQVKNADRRVRESEEYFEQQQRMLEVKDLPDLGQQDGMKLSFKNESRLVHSGSLVEARPSRGGSPLRKGETLFGPSSINSSVCERVHLGD